MTTCVTCGNDYDKAFRVSTADGRDLVFDSIECAAQQIAPTCVHCHCRILGHGVEADGQIFCCAHCAARSGKDQLVDRV